MAQGDTSSFFGGLLRGFNRRTADARAESVRVQELQDAKEGRILDLLANSDDPEISTAAVTAMLDKAAGVKPPKGGFLSQLMGPKTQAHPAVESLLKLVRSPAVSGEAPQMPPPAVPGASAPPPPSPSPVRPTAAARSTTFSPQVGQPPPSPLSAGSASMAPPPDEGGGPRVIPGMTPPPSPVAQGAGRGPVGGPMAGATFAAPPAPPQADLKGPPNPRLPGAVITPPRQLFKTTTQKALEAATATGQGRVIGLRAGLQETGLFTDAEQAEIIRDEFGGSRGAASSFRPLSFEAPNGRGGYDPIQVTFNNRTGEYETLDGTPLPPGTRPRTSTASTSLGTVFERAASALGYANGAAARSAGPEAVARVNAKVQDLLKADAFARGEGTGLAAIQTETNMPIGPAAAADQNVAATTTIGQLGAQPLGRPLPVVEVKQLAEYQDAIDMANDLALAITTAESGKPLTGLLPKLGQMAPNFISEFTGWGVDDKSRQAVIALARQIIGKAFEGGVLRKEDEIKYKDILPTIQDPPGVAAGKMALLKHRVAGQRQTRIDELSQAGFRTGGPPQVGGPPPNVRGRFTVTAPNGTVYEFDTQAAADAFKARIGG